jgi:hypothetical protein
MHVENVKTTSLVISTKTALKKSLVKMALENYRDKPS